MLLVNRLLLILLVGLLFTSYCNGQNHYYHNVVWGRSALTDTITKKIRWEVYIQNRRQNTSAGSLNAFKAPQFVSYWTWLNYSLKPNLRVGFSPFGYFKSWLLIANPTEIERQPITELRVAVRLDQDQRFPKLIYTNRYSLERRWRDLANNGVYLPNWRARYQARIEIPIRASWLHQHPLSFTAFDEIFIQFGRAVKSNPNVFDQNRIYGGFNYGVSKRVRVSLGYIYQIQQRNSGKEFDHANVLFGVLTLDNLFSGFKKASQ